MTLQLSPAAAGNAIERSLLERRSIRAFGPEPVPRQVVAELLEMACWSPSPHNSQPWRFTALFEASDKERLAGAMADRLEEELREQGLPREEIARQSDRSRARISSAAAGHAPNHHRTEPWRFVVLAGDARNRLGDAWAELVRAENPDSSDLGARIEKARAKPLRAPVIIVVAAVPLNAPKVIEIEEIEATAAAVENMLIAAHSLGLGAMWRTGKPAYDPAVKALLGFPANAHIVAFVYVGYSDLPELPPRQKDTLRHVEWRGWDED